MESSPIPPADPIPPAERRRRILQRARQFIADEENEAREEGFVDLIDSIVFHMNAAGAIRVTLLRECYVKMCSRWPSYMQWMRLFVDADPQLVPILACLERMESDQSADMMRLAQYQNQMQADLNEVRGAMESNDLEAADVTYRRIVDDWCKRNETSYRDDFMRSFETAAVRRQKLEKLCSLGLIMIWHTEQLTNPTSIVDHDAILKQVRAEHDALHATLF